MTPENALPNTGLLTVDLDALVHNWGVMGARLGAGTECGAVIKANAYGLGAEPVGRRLFQAGCRRFFFATFDEAREGRRWLPADADVILLGGTAADNAEACLHLAITPVLYNLEQVDRWAAVNRARAQAARCWVKVDTGMTRLGLSDDEFEALCAEPGRLAPAVPAYLMSHLACAEDAAHPLNRQQRERFEQALSRFRQCFPGVRGSLANSSGIFLGRAWHSDLVRPGAGLYGFAPQLGQPNPFRPVVSLALPVLQIRQVQVPVSVGYGALGRAEPPAHLAVAAGGYADGLHRTAGLSVEGMVAGVRVSSVGRMSMDTTIFDVSALAPGTLAPGGVIEVLNGELTVDLMTERTGAPGYDVLTSLGPRYRRHYLGETL